MMRDRPGPRPRLPGTTVEAKIARARRMGWLAACRYWAKRGRFLWGNPRTRQISVRMGGGIVLVQF